ncbi:hypothetical protein DEU56DRAFT_911553 [Suillus clintonianus]|uniref:uncharacterized protein n=1 Tax=Suillus clintonianus TaxID=1904413 RepID=UPI001B8850F4|nr:uncharacterized protein DEU56DRAFT_911553 [Suillus clintonianus]KAG2141059.1 hypothetical protein DEU56DRAFT_911553 [Suillus clintonianus]
MSDEHFAIKLELPAQLDAFSFSFTTTKPGPVKIEISIDKQLPIPHIRSFGWTSTTGTTARREVVDESETEPESPATVKCQKEVVDESETEPESPATIKSQKVIEYRPPKHKLTPVQPTSQVDWTSTLGLSPMSNELETPQSFTRWYHDAKQSSLQARIDEAGVETPPFKRQRRSPS